MFSRTPLRPLRSTVGNTVGLTTRISCNYPMRVLQSVEQQPASARIDTRNCVIPRAELTLQQISRSSDLAKNRPVKLATYEPAKAIFKPWLESFSPPRRFCLADARSTEPPDVRLWWARIKPKGPKQDDSLESICVVPFPLGNGVQKLFRKTTLHPAPCTLHPEPCILHPAPCTLHPASCTLNPAP